MQKTLVWMALAACALAVPAYAGADKPPGTGGQSGKEHGNSHEAHGKSHKCKAHSVGYIVGGTLVADGLVNREIGQRLFLSEETVKSHVRHLLAKLQARSRAHAVAVGFRRGLIA